MAGEKLDQAKHALRQALARLADGDVFSLVVFSTGAHCVFQPVVVNAERRHAIQNALQKLTAHTSTNLCGGLERGLGSVLAKKQATNLVLLVSDGLANEGVTDIDAISLRARAGCNAQPC